MIPIHTDYDHNPNDLFGFIISISLAIVGTVGGEAQLPELLKDILQSGAWSASILVAIGIMFKIDYRQLVKDIWHKIF